MAEIKKSKRSFEAAQINRLLASFKTFSNNINDDLKYDLSTLRARSNDLSKNDPLARKFFSMAEENIVGANGFILQSKAQDEVGMDSEANNAIEKHFNIWSNKFVDVRGKLSFSELTRMVVRSVARDGECLIRHVFDDRNSYGYSIQVLSGEKLSDINKESSANQNAIINGVEIDSYGVPLFYHIYVNKCTTGSPIIKIPASEITHVFIQEYSNQVRGFPWLTPVMTRLHVLRKYIEFSLQASAIGASSMGFFTQNDGDIDDLADDEGEDGELFSTAQGGTFSVLPKGFDFKEWNPAFPSNIFNDFIKGITRHIASGLGVSYNLLTQDLESTSYATIRASILDERNHWQNLQNSFIKQFVSVVYEKWLSTALLKSSIKLPNGKTLPVLKKEKFMNYSFIGRRFEWVDVKKDAEAKIMLVQNHLESPFKILAELGQDPESVLDDHAKFEAMCKERGITSAAALERMKVEAGIAQPPIINNDEEE